MRVQKAKGFNTSKKNEPGGAKMMTKMKEKVKKNTVVRKKKIKHSCKNLVDSCFLDVEVLANDEIKN